MKLLPVKSSNIAAIGYDASKSVLQIQFKGKDTVYEYEGVPPETHQELMAAKSVGSHYAKNIRGVFKTKALNGSGDQNE